MNSENFRVIDKPLIVNEAGILIYFYTTRLDASNKSQIAFEDSFLGYNFTENKLLTRLKNDNDFDEAYIKFIRDLKLKARPYLDEFFDDKNKDILNLYNLYEENDQDYFPFLADIFQNINVTDFKDFSYEIFKKKYDLFFLKFIGIDFEDEKLRKIKSYKDLKDFIETKNLLAYISKSDFPDEITMDLIRNYEDTRYLYQRLYPLVEKLSELIEDKFYLIEDLFLDNLKRAKKNSFKRVEKVLDQTGLIKEMNSLDRPIDIYGLIISSKTIMIQWLSVDLDDRFIKFGMFSDQKKTVKENKLNSLNQDLKILGDITRIDILDLLKDKSYYAKELSDKLFISPATLSYHLNQLQIKGFVGVRTEGRRSYYFLRKTGFKEVIRVLREFTKDIKEE